MEDISREKAAEKNAFEQKKIDVKAQKTEIKEKKAAKKEKREKKAAKRRKRNAKLTGLNLINQENMTPTTSRLISSKTEKRSLIQTVERQNPNAM